VDDRQRRFPGQDRQVFPDTAYVERKGRVKAVLIETNSAVRLNFVRTVKAEMNLHPTSFEVVQEPMRTAKSFTRRDGASRERGISPD
jgi:hypothetical protein